MHILAVAKNEAASDVIALTLMHRGFRVSIESTLDEALIVDRITKFEGVIYALEPLRGVKALATGKRALIVLSNDVSIASRVQALRDGADDFLTVPYDRRELLARTRAVIRRYNGHAMSLIEAHGVMLDLDNQRATIGMKPLHLTPKVYRMLECLLLHIGTTITKERMQDYIYGGAPDEPEPKILDVMLCKLRRLLEPTQLRIETVWGRGWRVNP